MAWSIPIGTTCLTFGTFERTSFTFAKSSMGSSSDSPRSPPYSSSVALGARVVDLQVAAEAPLDGGPHPAVDRVEERRPDHDDERADEDDRAEDRGPHRATR